MRNVELIQNTKTQMLDEIVDGLWPVIKSRARRQDAGPGVGQLEHVFEMDRIVRRLTRHEYESAALLETNIRRTMYQICPGARSDGSHRAHRARNDDHP